MSTYKSLGGPAGGLLLTNDGEIAEGLDRIAFPGMTANFDVARTAALALTMLDWREYGQAYATAMVEVAHALAEALDAEGVPVFARNRGFTTSHQFAVEATRYGGGQTASKALRKAGFLTSGIGLPVAPVAGDMNGLRMGTPEIVRWGVGKDDAPRLAGLIARALETDRPEALMREVRELRGVFRTLKFVMVA